MLSWLLAGKGWNKVLRRGLNKGFCKVRQKGSCKG